MLSSSLEVTRKIYEPYTRVHHLKSGEFGFIPNDDDHLIDRLSSVVKSLEENMMIYDMVDRIRDVPPPNLERGKLVDLKRPTEILLKDNFRQHKSIEERYRKGLPSLRDIRMLSDGATRVLWSSSRGFTRYLIDEINHLDGEMMNQKTLKPLL